MTPPTVAEAIRHRRSVRRFRPDQVPATLLNELLELTMEAPSSWNFQSRSVVAVRDPVALLLSVGYPAEQRLHSGRLPLHRVAFGDLYGESL
ncbi:nitroreductase family protein [Nocardiopsis valliformis]|uniref:nitroreductase family protein n=1 Tax=Nocardiopsis valliformis TaxID=239974 RepID=UPI00034CD433|nr:nitroreductase family protein [Nocardiopsis valliformis]